MSPRGTLLASAFLTRFDYQVAAVPPEALASAEIIDRARVCATLTVGDGQDTQRWEPFPHTTTRKALVDTVGNLEC